jgi:hypothetical protein
LALGRYVSSWLDLNLSRRRQPWRRRAIQSGRPIRGLTPRRMRSRHGPCNARAKIRTIGKKN